MNRNFLLPSIAIAILLGFGIAGFAYLHGADIAVLNPQGPIGLEERWVMIITVLLCSIVVVPVFALLFLFAWRYRATGPEAHKHHLPDWDHDNTAAEFAWWLVPAVIIVILSVIAWHTSNALDPYKPIEGSGPSLTVDVIALDWKWLFIYPDQGIASVNLLEFPANRPVHFYITSDAPMNSFWIPSLGGQIMAMPGMTTQLNLMADNPGTFNGVSGNISGAGFAGMAFTAKAVSSDEFDAWVESAKSGANPLDLAAYDALAAPSSYVPPLQYSSVENDVFDGAIMKYMAPGDSMTGMDMNGMNMTMPMHAP